MKTTGGFREKIKRAYQQFKEDAPGERFLNLYQRRQQQSKGPVATVLIVIVGLVLIVGGFLLGLIPGVPGIVLGVLGVALIATRFRRMAVWMDRAEVKLRKLWRKCRAA
jgi:UPF0716 family protein affecting phage T7 exclusion